MAHYAVLDSNNIVVEVFVGRDEQEANWEEHYSSQGQTVKRTSYNTRLGIHYTAVEIEIDRPDGSKETLMANVESEDQSKAFRKNYAAIGMFYDVERDAFMKPQPFPSWVLDEFSCVWEPPIPRPTDAEYAWSEQQLAWVAVPDDGKPYVWNAELEQWEAAL
jgi:hypothetical protein